MKEYPSLVHKYMYNHHAHFGKHLYGLFIRQVMGKRALTDIDTLGKVIQPKGRAGGIMRATQGHLCC